MEKVKHENSATRKKRNIKTMRHKKSSHEKSETRKK